MGKRSYTNEFKAQVVEYYKTHTVEETMQKFGIPKPNASKWALKAGVFKGQGGHNNHPLNFKHEVCQYYDNHTGVETVAKFGVTNDTLCRWRRELGYRNKSRGYNLYTEGLQPTVTKRERRNFVMTKSENGDLKAKVADLEYKLSAMELVVTSTLHGLSEEIKSTLEAFDL
jgi:transposase-like protein